jgi:pilus assembly protein Flp/PilA
MKLRRGFSVLAQQIWSNQAGQGMVEYALILVLFAVVVIVTLVLVGGQLQNVFQNVATAL